VIAVARESVEKMAESVVVRMGNEEKKVEEVLSIIKQVRYGEVVITIHNSEIMEIEKIEKMRFNAEKRLR